MKRVHGGYHIIIGTIRWHLESPLFLFLILLKMFFQNVNKLNACFHPLLLFLLLLLLILLLLLLGLLLVPTTITTTATTFLCLYSQRAKSIPVSLKPRRVRTIKVEKTTLLIDCWPILPLVPLPYPLLLSFSFIPFLSCLALRALIGGGDHWPSEVGQFENKSPSIIHLLVWFSLL